MFPIKYIDNNLVWNKDNEVFAYYELIQYNYSFLSPEQKYLFLLYTSTSPDEEKGVLLELKGKGCRQFESYLLAQERSWYDFLMDACLLYTSNH